MDEFIHLADSTTQRPVSFSSQTNSCCSSSSKSDEWFLGIKSLQLWFLAVASNAVREDERSGILKMALN